MRFSWSAASDSAAGTWIVVWSASACDSLSKLSSPSPSPSAICMSLSTEMAESPRSISDK